ncbi:hypothetical protein D9611_009395 [Ephemerocybe angulata]|uniref:SWIM-type domain-containing protein n=1 Tax=Ephemerocybe angulata TaxID=980116 RepID=A0A8H5BIA6_9AGAR|nr:hypothetical protein D9611_009395 [Tulosesus angulatus]
MTKTTTRCIRGIMGTGARICSCSLPPAPGDPGCAPLAFENAERSTLVQNTFSRRPTTPRVLSSPQWLSACLHDAEDLIPRIYLASDNSRPILNANSVPLVYDSAKSQRLALASNDVEHSAFATTIWSISCSCSTVLSTPPRCRHLLLSPTILNSLPSPSYHSTTVRHGVQTQFSSRPRSQSHPPSREDFARSLSRARYSPNRASPVVPGSRHRLAQSRNSPSSASIHSTSKPLRRSRRLSQSPVRQDIENKVEEVVVRLPPQCPSLGKPPVSGRSAPGSNIADYKSAQHSPWHDDDNDSALECEDYDDVP